MNALLLKKLSQIEILFKPTKAIEKNSRKIRFAFLELNA